MDRDARRAGLGQFNRTASTWDQAFGLGASVAGAGGAGGVTVPEGLVVSMPGAGLGAGGGGGVAVSAGVVVVVVVVVVVSAAGVVEGIIPAE